MARRKSRFNKLTREQANVIVAQFQKVFSNDPVESAQAAREIITAVELPIRKTLLEGPILDGIYEPMDFTTNPNVRFPLDLLTPGDEDEFYAYVHPGEGYIPMKRVEADYLMVPTYQIANSIDCSRRFIRDANWPVIQRMLEVLEAGFFAKMNDDGWQTIISAGVDRNVIVNDPNAAAGQFTPRLITLLQTFMRRQGGGNSGTVDRAKLTDLYVSPEAMMDIRAWTLDLVPDIVRAQIYNSAETDETTIFGVRIKALDELGEAQEYQNYFANTLGGSMAASDVEIVVGLDRQRNDSFIHPVREELMLFEDNLLHRRGLFGFYGHTEIGFAVLDSRRVLLGSL